MPRRCVVRGCPYEKLRILPIVLHTFPCNLTLRRIWLNLSGSNLTIEQLQANGFGICSHHFSDIKYVINSSDDLELPRKTLYTYALPSLNLPNATVGDFTYTQENVVELINCLCQNEPVLKKTKVLSEEVAKFQKQNTKAMKELAVEVHKVQKLEKKLAELTKTSLKTEKHDEKEITKKVEEKVEQVLSNIFTKCQIKMLMHKKQCKKWDEEDMSRAMAIYNCSSSCYVFLREQYGFPLPSKRSVLRWASKINIQPGLLSPVLTVMKEEFKNFTPMQRQSVICFDEVAIDSRVELEDKHQIILGPFKNLMGIYVRSLFYSWKQIVYFDFDLRLDKSIISKILVALEDAGVKIVALVSDMATVNVRVWNELGINIPADVLSFPHPVTEVPIWVLADFTHLIKLLRNHFLDKEIQLGEDFNFAIISKKIIEELLKIQNHDLQLTFKLTSKHLEMNSRERMDARTAFELFSETTANAIKLLLPQYEDAANFFLLVNNFADLFNVSQKVTDSSPFKSPFGTKLQQQAPLVDKFEKNISELRVLGGRATVKPFQKGFKSIIGGLRGIYSQMQEPPVSCDYIMPKHLTQDFVESSFSVFRGIGAFNDMPLPVDSLRRIKTMVISSNIRCPKTGNVHCENSTEFLSSTRLRLMIDPQTPEFNMEETEVNQNLNEKFRFINPTAPVLIPDLTLSSPEDISRLGGSEYVCGYIARKLCTVYPNLKATPDSDGFGWVKVLSRGHLTLPSEWWFGCFLKFEEYFTAFHKSSQSYKWDLNRDRGVIDNLTNYLALTFPLVPIKAIRLYVRLRTKIRIKAINKKIVETRRKWKAKKFMDSIFVSPTKPSENDIEDNENESENVVDTLLNEFEAIFDDSENVENLDEEDVIDT